MNRTSAFKRSAVLLYGLAAYVMFIVTFSYAAGFVGNFLVPKSIDSARTVSFWKALLIDSAVLALFAVQHSVMARPFFKRWITRFISEAAERSTFTLAASGALIALFWFWQPLGGTVWQVDNVIGRIVLHAGCAFGWLLVLATTFLINHFDLFGLRQVWMYFRQVSYTTLKFKTPALYKFVRHPLYLGFLFAFWCTPAMSAAHFFFAVMTAAYILVGIQLEERDLQTFHGEYAEYKRRTPMLMPRLRRAPSRQDLPRDSTAARLDAPAENSCASYEENASR